MTEKELVISNKLGMHLRPAALFAQTVQKFKSSVKVVNIVDSYSTDGRSIMGLMMIAAASNARIRLVIDGPDENELFEALKELVEIRKFDEE